MNREQLLKSLDLEEERCHRFLKNGQLSKYVESYKNLGNLEYRLNLTINK